MDFDNYIKIPMFVFDDCNISGNAKMLYGEILLLAHKEGYCYADSEYLARALNVTPRTITRLLKELADNDYIILKYRHKFMRKIFINEKKYTSIKLDEIF